MNSPHQIKETACMECDRKHQEEVAGLKLTIKALNQSIVEFEKDAQVVAEGWISVSDRLPEAGVNVLFYSPPFRGIPHSFVAGYWGQRCDVFGWASDTGSYWFGKDTVTHWQPLPEPPKEQP